MPIRESSLDYEYPGQIGFSQKGKYKRIGLKPKKVPEKEFEYKGLDDPFERRRTPVQKGAIFTGPKSGYPVDLELHGTEAVVPLSDEEKPSHQQDREVDMLPETKSLGLKSPVPEEDYGKRRDVEFRKEGGIPDGKPPSERGLKEEGWLKKTFARPFRWDQARLEKLEQENWLRDAQIRYETGLPHVGQATVSSEKGNLPQAMTHLKYAYEQILDGGEIEGRVKPFDPETRAIAEGAGNVEELIRIRQPDGNIVHLPLDKDNIQQLLNKAKAAFMSRTFITSTMLRKAANKESNRDQREFPTLHDDGRVSHLHWDETGKRETIWSDSMQDFEDNYGAPHRGWATPKGKQIQIDKARKGLKGATYTEEGMPIPLEEAGEYKGKQYAAALPRTTEKAPTVIGPSKLVKGRDEKGNEVNGFVANGKFIPMPNVSKIQDKKGDIDEKTITKMYAEFSKAYDAKFIDDTGEYVKGRDSEDREIEVEKSVRQVLPQQHWRRPKNLNKPQYSEKYKAWFAQDQLGEWWPMPNLPKPKPKKKLTLDEQAKKLGLTKPKRPLKPRSGIKEPIGQTPMGQKVGLPIRR